MMKKLFLGPIQEFFYGNSMDLRALPFSTQSLTSAITPLKPAASVVPILENWVKQGNEIKHSQLQEIIRDLRSTNRFNHALQTLQWMGDKGGYELSAEDIADQLELTSRVHGVKEVEMYFDAIPNNLRGYEVYCALLNSYALHRSVGKAEATMQKMRELGLVRDALPYNLMLNLYSKIQYDINILVKEMREKGIKYDKITYNILLKVYGENKFIWKMENVLRELEADPLVNIDWYHYFLAAQGYWLDEQVEKSLTMLKKSEESREGNLNEVYVSMILELSENGDMDGAERIWEEWFSKKKGMDFAIPRAMICGYGMNCQWEKAEGIVFRMRESGIEPDADTLYDLAFAYCHCQQMDKAVETSMKVISMSKPGWIPDELYTIAYCFEHLEHQGNDAASEELSEMLKDHCGVPRWVCDVLKSCESPRLPNGYLRSPRISLGSG